MAFRSGLEEKVADLLVNLGVKYEYESTKVPYVLQCNYTPDFLLPNGIYLETKGLPAIQDLPRRRRSTVPLFRRCWRTTWLQSKDQEQGIQL